MGGGPTAVAERYRISPHLSADLTCDLVAIRSRLMALTVDPTLGDAARLVVDAARERAQAAIDRVQRAGSA